MDHKPVPPVDSLLSLEQLDWKAVATLIGIGVGTALAVLHSYRKTYKQAAEPSKDVVLSTATIADMRWGPELVSEVKAMRICLADIQLCLANWRKEYELELAKEEGRREGARRAGRRLSD